MQLDYRKNNFEMKKKYGRMPYSQSKRGLLKKEAEQYPELEEFKLFSKNEQIFANLVITTATYNAQGGFDSDVEMLFRSPYFFMRCNSPSKWNAKNIALICYGAGLVVNICEEIIKRNEITTAMGEMYEEVDKGLKQIRSLIDAFQENGNEGQINISNIYNWIREKLNGFTNVLINKLKSFRTLVGFSIALTLYKKVLDVLKKLNPYIVNKQGCSYVAVNSVKGGEGEKDTETISNTQKVLASEIDASDEDEGDDDFDPTSIGNLSSHVSSGGASKMLVSNYKTYIDPLLATFSVYFPIKLFGNIFTEVSGGPAKYKGSSANSMVYTLSILKDVANTVGISAGTLLSFCHFVKGFDKKIKIDKKNMELSENAPKDKTIRLYKKLTIRLSTVKVKGQGYKTTLKFIKGARDYTSVIFKAGRKAVLSPEQTCGLIGKLNENSLSFSSLSDKNKYQLDADADKKGEEKYKEIRGTPTASVSSIAEMQAYAKTFNSSTVSEGDVEANYKIRKSTAAKSYALNARKSESIKKGKKPIQREDNDYNKIRELLETKLYDTTTGNVYYPDFDAPNLRGKVAGGFVNNISPEIISQLLEDDNYDFDELTNGDWKKIINYVVGGV